MCVTVIANLLSTMFIFYCSFACYIAVQYE